MVDAAKAAPGQITVGIDGIGGDDHIAVVAGSRKKPGSEFKIVPFDDGGEKMTALIGTRSTSPSSAESRRSKLELDTGTVIALAALDQEPIPGFEDVPTATSEGYDVFWESYTVLSAPVGISDEVLTTLEDALQKASEAAVEDPDFATR